ncbi:unnamed protein product, partial [Allacma fusca]
STIIKENPNTKVTDASELGSVGKIITE